MPASSSRPHARERARALQRQERRAERETVRAPAPDEALGARLQGLCGNEVLTGPVLGVREAFTQIVAENLALAAVGVDPAASSFSGSNQAMLRAMRATGGAGGAADGDAAVTQSLRRSGAPLPAPLQAKLEAHFGVSLGAVRVHTDATAAVASAAIQAHAFSTGTHVLFGQGEYRPHTPEGLELLAHEITHVVQHLQQRSGAATAVENGVAVTLPSDAVEREAVDSARAFVQSGFATSDAAAASAGPETAPAQGAPASAQGAPASAQGGEDVVGAPILESSRLGGAVGPDPAQGALGTATPSIGGGVMARNGGSTAAADTPDSHDAVSVSGGRSSAGGWEFARQPDGSWKVERRPETSPRGVTSDSSVSGSHTVAEGSTGVAAWGTGADGNGQEATTIASGRGGTVTGQGQALGASANGSVAMEADAEGFAIKAEGGAQLSVVGGKLRYVTPECAFTVLAQELNAEAYVEVTADVCAELKGELGLSLKPGGDGVSLDGGAQAFAGARAGIKGGIAVKWKPTGYADWVDVVGAFAGCEGWAGIAAAADASFSLYPSLKAEFNYGLAVGFGGSVTYGVEIGLLYAPALMLTLAARGAAVALDAVGLSYLADGLRYIVDNFWDDDAARFSVTRGLHRDLGVADRIKLCNRMLSGACMDDDEQAIITVFRDAIASGEIATLARGVEGGVLGLVEKFDGEEYATMMALLYVDAHITDIPLDDDVARKLVELGLHPRMAVEDVRRCINAMLDGFTGDADEASILRILRERPDFQSVLTADLKQRCLDDFNGEEYDALAGFLFLHDMLGDVDFDDDMARAVIRQRMHLAVDDAAKLKRCFDALISGATGDDDEACLVRLLLDKPGFTGTLSQTDLQDALADVDGEEHEDLLVALRKGRRIDLADTAYDVDDNVARKLVAQGVHTDLSVEEARRCVDELVGGMTGDEDENAILRILVDNPTKAAQILDTQEKRQTVLDNCHGEESDALIGVYVVYNLMPGLEIDDDVARALVRVGLHRQVTDGTVLMGIIDALIAGFTGDDDEAAIIAICKECAPVRPLLVQDKLTTILDNVDGEEHAQLVVWLRQNRVIADISADWVVLDDDDARALVDGVDKASLTSGEVTRLLRALNAGFTGDDDEARILAILTARADLIGGLDQDLVTAVIDNVDGEELSSLFVLLYQNNRMPTDPLPSKFDDDAARLFIERGFHRDAARWPAPACRSMLDKLMAGIAGDDDEARMITLIRDRRDTLTGKDDTKIDELIEHCHGEEETQLFVALFEQDKLKTNPFHGEFDDDAARTFVDRGFHTGGKLDVDACKHLLDKMMAGFAGDDDEARMIKLLTDRTDVLQGLTSEKIDEIVDHTHGEEETRLFVLLQRNGKLTLPHGDFDDDAARAFIAEGLHRAMTAAQLVHLVNAMVDGGTFNDDENALLTLFRDKPEVLDTLGQEKIRSILQEFDGDEWDALVVYLYRVGKGGIDLTDASFTRLDDNTARIFVSEGLHTRMNAAEIKRLLDELQKGSCGDDDEDAILRILREAWGNAEPTLTPAAVNQLLAAVDGEQDDRLQALLWEKNKLPAGWSLDDDVARGLVREGKHRGADLPRARQILDAMIAGFTGDDDEAMILELLRGNAALLAGLTPEDVDTIYTDFNGDEESELLVLLLEAGKIDLSSDKVDDNAARLLVTRGKHRTFTADQNQTLVRKMLSGATMQEDESAILTILTDKSGETAAILAGITLDNLFGGFQGDNYYALTKKLLAANFQRDAILDGHVTAPCAYWLVHNQGTTGLSGAQKGKLAKKLWEMPSVENGRAVIHLFENDTANIGPMVDAVGLASLNRMSPEAAELHHLVFKHVPAHRDAILEDADGLTAARLVRGRAYQADMNDDQRAKLIRRLVDRAPDGQRDAFEVLDWAKRNNPAGFTALVERLGGREATKGLFSGAIRTDVERLLAPASST